MLSPIAQDAGTTAESVRSGQSSAVAIATAALVQPDQELSNVGDDFSATDYELLNQDAANTEGIPSVTDIPLPAQESHRTRASTRLVNATPDEHRHDQPSTVPTAESQRFTPEGSSQAEVLWNSVRLEPPIRIRSAPGLRWSHSAPDIYSSHESNNSTVAEHQAGGQRLASRGSSGSSTAPSTLKLVRRSGIPLPAVRGNPESALITRLRELFPNQFVLETQMLELIRFLNKLLQLRSSVLTPTWLEVYPAFSTVKVLNLRGVYEHLFYAIAPRVLDSVAKTDVMCDAALDDNPRNPGQGHSSGAVAAEDRSPSDTSDLRSPDHGHPLVAVAAEGRSPPDNSVAVMPTTSSTERRRGTPRASSRGHSPRSNITTWLYEARRGDW